MKFCDGVNSFSSSQDANFAFIRHDKPGIIFQLQAYAPALRELLTAFFRGKAWHIWGAGTYGKIITDFLERGRGKLQGIIDSSPEKQGTYVTGIKISSWEDAEDVHDIFVAIKDRDAFMQVQDRIWRTAPEISIYGIDDLWSVWLQNRDRSRYSAIRRAAL